MKNKNKIALIILIAMLGTLITGCARSTAASSWPGYTINEEIAYLSYSAETYAVNLSNGNLVWKYPAEADRTRQAYAAPVTGEGITVFGDYNGTLVAVNAENGTEQWVFSGAEDRYIGSASIVNGIVYAPNTDGYIYALDLQGNLQWKFKTAGPNWTQPVSDENNVYFASMDHSIYAFDQIFNSKSLTLAEDGSKTLRQDTKWMSDLGMAIVADPIIEDGIIYVATIESKLFAINAENGKIQWSFNNGGDLGSIWGKPVIGDSVIYVSDVDGNIFAIDKGNGKQVWPSAFSTGSGIVGGGVMTEAGAIFATVDGKLFLINSEKESKTISTFESPLYSPLLLNDGNIIVAPVGEDALIAAIDQDGFEVWSFMPVE